MFDIIDLPKTPRIARRLIEMSFLGGLDVDPEIKDLALTNLVSIEKLNNLPFPLEEKEIAAVQFIADRRGRAVVLEDATTQANNSVLSHVWLTNKFPVLFLTNTAKHAEWVVDIRNIWPDAIINIFGIAPTGNFLQNIMDINDPNIFITKAPREGSDFYITKPTEVYKSNLLKMHKFEQVIIKHVTDIGSATKSTLTDLNHICLEIAASIVVINICQCVSQARASNFICFEDVKWENENNLAIKASKQFLYPNIRFLPYIVNEYEHLSKHVKENNITISAGNWLPIMNICPHLVK